MASTTYGGTPGVEITVRGVAITGVVVGREQKLVVFGNGDTSNGTAESNELTPVTGQADADNKFGPDSELTGALRSAIGHGASQDYLYGVAPTVTSVTAEAVAGGSGTLANAPIVEDTSEISVQNTTASQSETPVFVYDSEPSTGDLSNDEVAINPLTGEVAAGDSDDYEIDYDYLEWQDALDAADGALNEKETGIYLTVSEAESVASLLSSKVNALRDPEYKMVRGVCGVQPNAVADGTEYNLDEGDAKLDVSSYSHNLDNDSLFMVGPVRREDTDRTVLGAIGGMFAGHDLTNPVYKDALSGVSPEQRLNKSDRDTLRDSHQVIAISKEGSTRLHSNTSTSSETDWERDFHRRRIVDQSIILAKQVGDSIEGDLNSDNTQLIAEQTITAELEGLANDGLLEPNTDDDENMYVDVREVGPDEVAIDMGITPEGVVKTVSVDIAVDT